MGLTEDKVIDHMSKWSFKENKNPKKIHEAREAFKVVVLEGVDFRKASKEYGIYNFLPNYRSFLYNALEMIGDCDSEYTEYIKRCLKPYLGKDGLDITRSIVQERKLFWYKVIELYVPKHQENNFHNNFKNCVSNQRFWG